VETSTQTESSEVPEKNLSPSHEDGSPPQEKDRVKSQIREAVRKLRIESPSTVFYSDRTRGVCGVGGGGRLVSSRGEKKTRRIWEGGLSHAKN